MMLITSLEKVSKTRTRVTIDYDETLVLSDRDLAAYNIRLNEELDESVYGQIREALRTGAVVRAASILKGMDYTAQGLTDKLIRVGYPADIAADTVERFIEAGYINDRRYAENYVRVHVTDRSLARIRNDLRQRGISKDLLEDVLQNYEDENGMQLHEQEGAQIRRFLTRRHYDPDTMTYEDTARIKAALLRKGFSMESIRREMDAIN